MNKLRVRQGNIHQGMVRSFGQGFQCTMIAVIALIMVYNRPELRPSDWNAQIIDSIIMQGSAEYDRLILSSDRNYPRYLAHNEVPQFLDFMGNLFQVDIHDGLFYGVIGQEGSIAAMSILLSAAVNTGLNVSPMLLFTAGEMTVSIFCDGCEYFVFHSHASDKNGLTSAAGSAVLMSFATIHDLFEYFHHFYDGREFNISPVNFMCVNQDNLVNHSDLQINARTATQPCHVNVSDNTLDNGRYGRHSPICLNASTTP